MKLMLKPERIFRSRNHSKIIAAYLVSVRIEVGLEMYFPIFLPIVQIEYNVPKPRRKSHT